MDETLASEFDELDTSDDLRESIKPELEPGERLLWASRPGFRVQKQPKGGHLVGLVWIVGMLVLCVGCLLGSLLRGPRFESLVVFLQFVGVIAGLISFLIFLGMFSGYVSGNSARSQMAGQVYALTDRRAIMRVTDPKTQAVTVHSYHRGTIKSEHLHRIQYPDGSGDVLFLEPYREPAGFLDVADVRRVEGLIRRFLIASDPGSTS